MRLAECGDRTRHLHEARLQTLLGASGWSVIREEYGRILIPVRELTVWIAANILLQRAYVPFDTQDKTLLQR